MAEFEQIIVEQIGEVVRITLNRPERLNVWTPKMMAELTQVIQAANDDASIGAVVVTGAGRGLLRRRRHRRPVRRKPRRA